MSGFGNRQVDAGVVARARIGDMAAHELIFRTFSAPVYSLALRITGSPPLADDMLQETFLEVMRSIAGYRGEAALGTWIRHIAVSKCLMHARSPWRRLTELLPGPEESIEPAGGQGAAVRAIEPLEIDLERALQQLPLVGRAVVLLHDVEGYTHEEIAQLVGKTVSFSKSQLARAHQRLRALLGEAPARRDSKEPAARLTEERLVACRAPVTRLRRP